MRNLFGVSIVNLIFVLFFVELLFIVFGLLKLDWMCFVIGMVLYYLFLVFFFWMNVMFYDLYKIFVNKCIFIWVRSKVKYLLCYVLYVWGILVIIVVVCVVIDYIGFILNVKIRYGGGFFLINSFRDFDLSDFFENSIMVCWMELMDENLGCWI